MIETNNNKIGNLEILKNKNLSLLENNINSNKYSLENHINKTELMYREFEELKNKLEKQDKIYESEILNRKEQGEKV